MFKYLRGLKKFRLFVAALAFIICVSPMLKAANDSSNDNLVPVNLPGWVLDAALKFLNNPDDVFYSFHLDNVDYTPIREEVPATLRTNFLTSFLPFTWANANLKLKMMSDGKFHDWMPQVDVVGSYGRIIALDIASAVMDSSDEFKPPTMSDYSIGLTLTKPVSRETRIYAGFHYSVITLDIEFPDELKLTDETTVKELVIGRKDYLLVTGISDILSDEKRVVAYFGYGFKYRKLFSRFAWYYDHLELGFNVYPEALLVVHPFLAWHWDF